MKLSGRPIVLAAALAASLAAPRASLAETAQGQQVLVDRATLAAQEILGYGQANNARALLPQARAVMICPRVFRAGFFFGAEGGGCVLLARGGQGSWSSPAFFTLASGSFGLQIGAQDAEVMLMILTDNGLRAVLNNQFKLGANASVAIVTLGAGVQGSTTTNLNADIVAFEKPRGFFAGFSIEGSVISANNEGNEAYYGTPTGAVEIVIAVRVNNPAADALRSVLMRYGNPAPVPALPPPVPQASYQPPQGGGQVQAESLAPPR